ncbi:hypothetical protein FQA39_LY18511 [Lamprigera yunnana]|nr:hypothetical protein FQA39_LY18511 [Lamprigera yunnana]
MLIVSSNSCPLSTLFLVTLLLWALAPSLDSNYPMQPNCPHCGKGFSRKDNVIRPMRSTCHNMKNNELEPEEQSKHRLEISLKRKRENVVISQLKVFCPECNEEIPQSCYRAQLRTNRHKANACRFLEDGMHIIRSTFDDRLMSYSAIPLHEYNVKV